MSVKVLYLEDEHYLGRIVKESLESRGYDIRLITDGKNVIQNFKQFDPDICVLDVMVPSIDGFTLGIEIRSLNAHVPIIYLTAKNQTADVLKGFASGGNDYIKKPFSMEELIVRIDNLMKFKLGTEDEKQKTLVIGSYTYNYTKFELKYKDEKISLSHRENELLKIFTSNMNQKIDRRTILKELWGDDSLYNSRNLDVYIRKLRIYFERDPKINLITLRGVGYHFNVED